jgi:hypothetical protein
LKGKISFKIPQVVKGAKKKTDHKHTWKKIHGRRRKVLRKKVLLLTILSSWFCLQRYYYTNFP